MVCHMYRTTRGVTADNFFTRCELASFILTKNMTVAGTLRKNEPEIPALFHRGKLRDVFSSVFHVTSDLTLVSYVDARNKAVILLESQDLDDMCMGEEKDHKPKITMHYSHQK